jgi:hypothetical protein
MLWGTNTAEGSVMRGIARTMAGAAAAVVLSSVQYTTELSYAATAWM